MTELELEYIKSDGKKDKKIYKGNPIGLSADFSTEKALMLGKTEGRRRGQQDDMVGWHH